MATAPTRPGDPRSREQIEREKLTQEVRYELEMRHGYFATLSPEFERRVTAEVERRLDLETVTLTEDEREVCRNAAIAGSNEVENLIRIIERLTGERFLL